MRNDRFPAWLFMLVGVGLTCLGCYFYIQADTSAPWPQVEGKIVKSAVEEDWLHSGENGEGSSYRAVVKYEYVVDGHGYSCDRIAFGQSGGYSGGEKEARTAVDRYPEGSSVAVYYDPADPSSATLERGAGGFAPIVVLVGILFVAVSLVGLWAEKHQNR